MSFRVLSQFEFLNCDMFWVSELCYIFSFWVWSNFQFWNLSHFEFWVLTHIQFLSLIKFLVVECCLILSFEFCHILSFFSFVTFCHRQLKKLNYFYWYNFQVFSQPNGLFLIFDLQLPYFFNKTKNFIPTKSLVFFCPSIADYTDSTRIPQGGGPSKYFFLNSAYRRQSISRPMRTVAQIPQ